MWKANQENRFDREAQYAVLRMIKNLEPIVVHLNDCDFDDIVCKPSVDDYSKDRAPEALVP